MHNVAGVGAAAARGREKCIKSYLHNTARSNSNNVLFTIAHEPRVFSKPRRINGSRDGHSIIARERNQCIITHRVREREREGRFAIQQLRNNHIGQTMHFRIKGQTIFQRASLSLSHSITLPSSRLALCRSLISSLSGPHARHLIVLLRRSFRTTITLQSLIRRPCIWRSAHLTYIN